MHAAQCRPHLCMLLLHTSSHKVVKQLLQDLQACRCREGRLSLSGLMVALNQCHFFYFSCPFESFLFFLISMWSIERMESTFMLFVPSNGDNSVRVSFCATQNESSCENSAASTAVQAISLDTSVSP